MAASAALGAAIATALLLLTWYLAFHVGVFERADVNILGGFIDLHRPRVDALATFIAGLCNPSPYVYFAGAVVVVALVRRRPDVALMVALIIFGANFTTQLLKPLLAASRLVPIDGQAVGAAAWPSGHATAAMSLALCSVLVAPVRLRPAVAALGAAFAVAVSYSFLTLNWHYPSDVFGGFLVATVWTLIGIAVLSVLRARYRQGESAEMPADRPPIRDALRPPAAVLLAAVGCAGLVALARPHQVVSYTQAHTAFVVGASAIAALALALATGVMLTLRR